MNLEVRIANLY